jgi:hypothetical protein
LSDNSDSYYKGKEDGLVRTYFPNRKIKTEGYHKSGLKDSVWRVFNEKGIILGVNHWANGGFIGECIEYDEKGSISNYRYFLDSTTVALELTYSATGKLVNGAGKYMIDVVPDKPNYKVGDSVICHLKFAKPPLDSISIGGSFHMKKDSINSKWKRLLIINDEAFFSDKVIEKGDYILEYELIAVNTKAGKAHEEMGYSIDMFVY